MLRTAPTEIRSASGQPALLLHLALVAATLTLVGLAVLWLLRNPMLNTWDEVMHMNFSLSDASLWRSDSISALRDAIFLSNRWLPPGLRLIGLPIAALSDAAAAPIALRISATVLTVLTLAVIYIGLRPIAGYGGAAAGALLFALSPLNLVGAQAFMTELVLHLCLALSLALLAWEVVAKRPSTLRLILLGPVLGLGALAKLTFLPTIGLAWLGCVAYRWFIERDAKELRLRLAVPAVGLALVAWPHYLLNGARYVSYAKATALGYAYSPAEERGIAFLLRAFGSFSWDMLGIGGVVLLLVAAVLAVLHWRRLTGPERTIMALAALAAAPPVMAYLLSRNQTERYLGLSVVALAFPVGIAVGASLRDGLGAARVRALIAAPAAAAFVQIGLCWFIAVCGPVETRAFRPIDDAAWRQNEMCDFRPVTEILPRGTKPLRVGVFGLTIGVHAFVVEQAFLLDAGPSKVIELVDSSTETIDWPRLMREISDIDLLLVPEELWAGTGDVASHGVNQAVGTLRARLAETSFIDDLGPVPGGPDPACTIHALAVRPHDDPDPPRHLLRPEVRLPPGVGD